ATARRCLGFALSQRAGVRAARHRPFAGRGHCAYQPRPGARISARGLLAMSDQSEDRAPLGARVIEVDAAAAAAPPQPLAPQIIPTERTAPITPSEPALPAVARA